MKQVKLQCNSTDLFQYKWYWREWSDWEVFIALTVVEGVLLVVQDEESLAPQGDMLDVDGVHETEEGEDCPHS